MAGINFTNEQEHYSKPLKAKSCGYTLLPAVYGSIEEAVNDLKLDKRVKWKVWNNELCRYTKKSICPEYVVKNGMPVQINCR